MCSIQVQQVGDRSYPTDGMAIPPFDNQGVLPLGAWFDYWNETLIYQGHDCALSDVRDVFVTSFPDSHTRPVLFSELTMLVGKAKQYLDCFQILVSGEFVTAREDPEDILIALDVPGDDLSRIDPEDIWLLHRFFSDGEYRFGNDNELLVNTRLVRAYAPDHGRFEVGYHERLLARYLSGFPIPDTLAGYVECLECEGRWPDVAAIFEAAPNRD